MVKEFWLCLSLTSPQYLATPVSLEICVNLSHSAGLGTADPTVTNVELSQAAPMCFLNSKRVKFAEKVPKHICPAMVNRGGYQKWNSVWCQPAPGIFFICGTNAYLCLPGS